jgi:hypothetical protein
MICIDKILFTDTTQLADLKAGNPQGITTVNSKKDGDGGPVRHNIQEVLQLTLKLATAKCQLNMEIVSEKYQTVSSGNVDKL